MTVICHVFLCRIQKFSIPELPNQPVLMVGTHTDGHRYMIPEGRQNLQRTLGSSLVPSNPPQSRKLNQSKNAENGGADSNEPHQLISVKMPTEAVNGHAPAPVENEAQGKQHCSSNKINQQLSDHSSVIIDN